MKNSRTKFEEDLKSIFLSLPFTKESAEYLQFAEILTIHIYHRIFININDAPNNWLKLINRRIGEYAIRQNSLWYRTKEWLWEYILCHFCGANIKFFLLGNRESAWKDYPWIFYMQNEDECRKMVCKAAKVNYIGDLEGKSISKYEDSKKQVRYELIRKGWMTAKVF